jgi:hypothetical protein
MPGGLLNILAYGNQNVILNGNPSKTFFKTVYAKYTNFGLQKFRVDYNGLRELKLNEESTFTFKMPRYAELLMETYLVFNLPDIWSPIRPPVNTTDCWKPYQFRWVPHVGVNAVKEVSIIIGGQLIQRLSGDYLRNMANRDYMADKKETYYKMVGHEKEVYQPEWAYKRYNRYPNIFFNPDVTSSPEPSIRGRTLYVPLNFWFMQSAKAALPMVALQYAEVHIEIKMRPIRELFTINDVSLMQSDGFDPKNMVSVQPNFVNEWHQLYRFLQPPPDITLAPDQYLMKPANWNADVHILATYCFLTDEEARVFAGNEQRYLIKDVRDYYFPNVTGNRRLTLDTSKLVSSWMWFFRRHDAYQRNQWSNYTNWPYYDTLPYDVVPAPTLSTFSINNVPLGPGINFTGRVLGDNTVYETVGTNIYVNPLQTGYNVRDIMTQMAIIFNGEYRETDFDRGVYNHVEKFKRCSGNSEDGLYTYSFGLTTDHSDLQPSGAMNLSMIKTIELAVSTILPNLNPNATFSTICDAEGTVIGTTQTDIIYEYMYDLFVHEESWNMLRFISGQVGLVYAR